ncbi:hypothetical protein KY290_012204 [Solanum tuberosum]|uniref:HAT C-terminal dimerisation domain-containing protein n=1 Tax=Solanum tuberosum TaxID=4113 RepID=A0ABQ7W5E5_SOLTU|nr:hypothetical protein KY290_012204 [Solanum tuberosum]
MEVEGSKVAEKEITPMPAIVRAHGSTLKTSTSSTTCNPPKKQKRATISGQDPSHGGSGRETSQIWYHFEKILDKKGEQKGKCNYCSKVLSCPNHKGETIAKGIKACLLDWGVENLFTVTLDNATANSAAITHLKARINDWKGLSEQNESISRVRLAMKYVKSSASRTDSFRSYVEKVKVDTRGLLSLDVETRSGDPLLSNMAKHMEICFTKYWGDLDDMNMLLYWILDISSKSAFSTCGRILDCYRSSLSPKTAEALICSQQWLRTATFKEYKFEDLLDEIQNLEILEKKHPGTPLRID